MALIINGSSGITWPGTVPLGSNANLQYVEGKNCKHLRNKQVVLSFTCHVSNARLTNIKAGIIEWTSTEDTITSDPVSSWGAGGTTPTLASNFAFKNTPASLAATTTPVRYSVYATLGNTFNNLAVMIWADGAANNANDIFYITDVQLEEVYVSSTSPQPTAYEWRDIGQVRRDCQRYYAKTFPQGTAPAQNTGSQTGALVSDYAYANASGCTAHWDFVTLMRTSPTITLYNPNAANANARDTANSHDTTCSSDPCDRRVRVLMSVSTQSGYNYAVHAAANARL